MHAALSLIETRGTATPYTVVLADQHRHECGCDELLCTEWQDRTFYQPTRSQLESARRALRTLADRNMVRLDTIRALVAVRRVVPRAERVYADDRRIEWENRQRLVARTAKCCTARKVAEISDD
ncbi:MAG TPA: hypothetical protein VGH99_11750 [Pseudonocardia sp.]|jgi:hypothetical protein